MPSAALPPNRPLLRRDKRQESNTIDLTTRKPTSPLNGGARRQDRVHGVPMKAQVFRVDKFIVPSASRDEFLEQIHLTHELLRSLAGFIQDFILEQIGGPGAYNIVTTVIWEHQAAIQNARDRVHESQRARGFEPQKFWERLGIQADLGNYKRLEA